MDWRQACNQSPFGVAVKQFSYGFVVREASGKATFFTYKDFPYINRPATPDEISVDSGWIALTKKLPTSEK